MRSTLLTQEQMMIGAARARYLADEIDIEKFEAAVWTALTEPFRKPVFASAMVIGPPEPRPSCDCDICVDYRNRHDGRDPEGGLKAHYNYGSV